MNFNIKDSIVDAIKQEKFIVDEHNLTSANISIHVDGELIKAHYNKDDEINGYNFINTLLDFNIEYNEFTDEDVLKDTVLMFEKDDDNYELIRVSKDGYSFWRLYKK